MSKNSRQNGRRKSGDPSQRKLHEVVASLFTTSTPTSSQSGPSKGFRPRESLPRPTGKATSKATAPMRGGREVIVVSNSSDRGHVDKPIVISSDSASISAGPAASTSRSHITISSDSVSESKTNSHNVHSVPAPVRILRPRSVFLSSSEAPARPQRRQRLTMSKTKPPVKRKHDDSEDEPAQEPVYVSRQPPSSRSAVASPPARPLAPKDNVPSFRGRVESHRKSSPFKKARLSSPEPMPDAPSSGNDADVEELIPSSQSDEQELCVPKAAVKNPQEVKESVHKWRQEAVPAEPILEQFPPEDHFTHFTEPEMQTDPDVAMADSVPLPTVELTKGSVTPRSEAEVSTLLHLRSSRSTLSSSHWEAPTSDAGVLPATLPAAASAPPAPISADYLSISPPPLDLPPRPPTPVALSMETKTAQIVADIRAQAEARDDESFDQDVPLEFKDLESSSDEDDGFLQLMTNIRGKGKASRMPSLSSSPLSNLDSSPQPQRQSARYNLRRKFLGPKPAVSKSPLTPAAHSVRKPRRAVDPLEQLLKEKRLADKRGNGSKALLAAEAAASSPSQSKLEMRLEMDAEEESDADPAWADEDAAMQVVQQGARGLTLKSSSPVPADAAAKAEGETESADEDLEEADCEKILGAKGGKAVGKILANDRKNNYTITKGKKKQRVVGVPLWESPEDSPGGKADDDMQVESALPSLPSGLASNGHPIIFLLRRFVDSGDAQQLTAAINSGVLSLLGRQVLSYLLPWLFQIAVSNASLARSSHLALLRLCALDREPDFSTGCPFSLVVSALSYLGAKPDALEAQGWNLSTNVQSSTVDTTLRPERLDRLVSLITTFAQQRALSPNDVPDFILSLLLIGLDASASAQLKRDIAVAIEYLAHAIAAVSEAPSAIERNICAKIVDFAKTLTPVNKAHIFSLVIGGSPYTNRIARWVAYSLLLDSGIPPIESYSHLPALAPLIELLSPPSGSEGLFDIQGSSDNEDFYEDLACHVDILSKVLTSVDLYVAEEKQVAQKESVSMKFEDSLDDAKTKGNGKEKQPLEQIRILLEGLHGKIVDTRAAHLDRSRAKAALQQLAIRLHYQRIAGLRSTAKQRNLDGYFTSK
ncbi:hypothetical protein SCP_0307060 [Sparassis crispa]|uniref:Uncharacterized protein n=1 Tax=Sparassis crispa TaxID=139825 RepID=A0A401GFV4_9APHY|nr:hypothetical protein SCP_0307060 [Sparassis crispa]GBE80983.1 hypothetical protein SCP_0307060 [Sparassis crispa]